MTITNTSTDGHSEPVPNKGRPTQKRQMAVLIDIGIAEAIAEHRVVDEMTARRIAACLHRGLGSELERFAATGRIQHIHAARLELFYSARGDRAMQPWCQALKDYLRNVRGDDRNSKDDGDDGDSGSGPSRRPITPPPAGMSCDPEAAVVYAYAGGIDDHVHRPGLALHIQLQACRDYVHHRLHRHLDGSFADQHGSRGCGVQGLLAHLANCHNQQVVVQRLDRLPPGGTQARRVAALGARVLSATEHHTRRLASQQSMNTDLNKLSHRKDAK